MYTQILKPWIIKTKLAEIRHQKFNLSVICLKTFSSFKLQPLHLQLPPVPSLMKTLSKSPEFI